MQTLLERDLDTIWHPCSQMKDYATAPIIEIERAKGGYLYLKNGNKVLDGISSWWCKSLGHGHPKLQQALMSQAIKYEHVIGTNTCQEILIELSEKLCRLQPHLKKVFYATEGSSAIEIALKMSLHARKNLGQVQKNKIIAFENGYHGETLLALSVSDLGLYRNAYQDWMLSVNILKEIPYVENIAHPLWNDCAAIWPRIQCQLDQWAETTTAIIFEPVLQGAGGMKIYSQDFLKRIALWAKKNDIHLIADEIMTGFGRTGKMLACEYADIQPNFICLGKALTGGYMPMSAVLTTNAIYDIFYDDYAKQKNFLHSHTYSGNALAAAVASKALDIYQQNNFLNHIQELTKILQNYLHDIAMKTNQLINVRGIGGVVAAEIPYDESLISARTVGIKVAKHILDQGVLVRPLGNTLYWLPPLNSPFTDLEHLSQATKNALLKL